MKKGFTLIEILIVILIIGILAAIAWPGYQKTVERSRASEVESLFGNVVQSQRMNRMETDVYSQNWKLLAAMPPKVAESEIFCIKGDNQDYQANCTDTGTAYEVKLYGVGMPGEESHVVATRKNNSYFGEYQLYRFYDDPEGTVYCRADTPKGENFCLMFASGEFRGLPDSGGDSGGQCTPPCTESCDGMGGFSNCQVTWKEDGSSTWVYCEDGWTKGCYTYDFDSDGKLESMKMCTGQSGGVCTEGWEKIFDETGRTLHERQCTQFNSSGQCTRYGNGLDYFYDGDTVIQRQCSGSGRNISTGECSGTYYSSRDEWTYDSDGNLINWNGCADAGTRCGSYWTSGDYTYDDSGNLTQYRYCQTGSGISSSTGNCGRYSHGSDYSYDSSGNMVSERECSAFSGSACTAYNLNKSYDYTYHEDGTVTRQTCNAINSAGVCSSYAAGIGTVNTTYDAGGNKITTVTTCYDPECKTGTYESSMTDNGSVIRSALCTLVDGKPKCE